MFEKKVLLADDHFVVRQGIKMMLNSLYPKIKLFQAVTIEEAKKVLEEVEIDLIILDAVFPEGVSLNEIKKIKALYHNCKILIFTALDDNTYGPLYLNAGADGFLSKMATEEEIKFAIDEMFENGKYINKNLREKIVNAYLQKSLINPLEKLSEQELQVMLLMVKGEGNLEICNILGLKPTTISTYKSRIFEKLSVKNLPELIEIYNIYKP